MRLGVNDDTSLLVRLRTGDRILRNLEKYQQEARFLISEQKYLELLESNRTTAALYVLRNELAPLEIDSDHLHLLSRLVHPRSRRRSILTAVSIAV